MKFARQRNHELTAIPRLMSHGSNLAGTRAFASLATSGNRAV
jgi:hypothetical protein